MPDVGVEAVRVVHELMLVDEEWTDWSDRGFTWWAYHLAQHVRADPVRSDGRADFATLRIWTDLVTGVQHPERAAQLVAVANAQQSMNALVWDPERAVVAECCTAVVTAENLGWFGRVISVAAVLQNTAAHSRAHAVAETLGGVPAASAHPRHGEREGMDDVLNVPQQVVVPSGAGPSKFDGQLLERLESFVQGAGLLGFAGEGGFTCEVPFTGTRTTAEAAALGGGPPETALVQVSTAQPHPQLGSGALVTLQLPISSSEPADIANQLNLLEFSQMTDTSLLGAWCPDPTSEGSVAFAAFLPNVIAQPGILENTLLYLAGRSRFAAGVLS